MWRRSRGRPRAKGASGGGLRPCQSGRSGSRSQRDDGDGAIGRLLVAALTDFLAPVLDEEDGPDSCHGHGQCIRSFSHVTLCASPRIAALPIALDDGDLISRSTMLCKQFESRPEDVDSRVLPCYNVLTK